MAETMGYHVDPITLKIILPVGISFYTFQSLSYTIIVYRKKMHATNNLIHFMAFVSFFPQLVAGPIERASNLLPQFYKRIEFKYDFAISGCKLILWGFIKKVVIADSLADVVNSTFKNHSHLPGSDLFLGAVYFAIQIYGDFSGYSDIAIGTARLFGFDLMQNFNKPYFSRDISEFWRRWHISLSTWFRDYVYIPLGGSQVSEPKKIRNIFIVFLVSGFWHGANWTFIIWGFIHWLFYLPLLIWNLNRKNLDPISTNGFLPTFKDLIQMLSTFTIVTFAWIFFRAATAKEAIEYLSGIFSKSIFSKPVYFHYVSLMLIAFLLSVEWFTRMYEHPFQLESWPRHFRWLVYSTAICLVLFNFSFHKPAEFIYFQF